MANRRLSLIVLILLTHVGCLRAGEPLRWMGLADGEMSIHGLPWFQENGGELVRLPARCKDLFRPAIWSLAKSPSGARVRFRSDTQVLAIRLEYPSPGNMTNMHAFGQTGVDVYTDGAYIATAIADKDAENGTTIERTLFDFSERPRASREITLYMPLYKPVKVVGIGVEANAKVAAGRPFALSKPVVFYGTSITQGGCASRPGMSYEAIVGRKLDLDFVNLGFNGNGLGEPEVASAVAEIDAACFVLDFGANHATGEAMRAAYGPFLETLRSKRPDTPIVAITPIYTTRERRSVRLQEDWQERREFIRQLVQRRISDGDKHLHVVEGTDLLSPDQGDGLVDGSHPNDLGFYWIAEKLAPHLRTAVDLH